MTPESRRMLALAGDRWQVMVSDLLASRSAHSTRPHPKAPGQQKAAPQARKALIAAPESGTPQGGWPFRVLARRIEP